MTRGREDFSDGEGRVDDGLGGEESFGEDGEGLSPRASRPRSRRTKWRYDFGSPAPVGTTDYNNDWGRRFTKRVIGGCVPSSRRITIAINSNVDSELGPTPVKDKERVED